MTYGQETGLFDKNGRSIRIGSILTLEVDGDIRHFNVEYKTVVREVISHPDFDAPTTKVAITGVVFNWRGYDLFPCVDNQGISDTSKMTIVGYWADNAKEGPEPGGEEA